MELLDLSHNDDIVSIARKCNINFKKMWSTIRNMSSNQARSEHDETNRTINNAINSLVNTTIPNAVSSQISALDISGQIRVAVTNQIDSINIPQVVSDEIDNRITDAYPEIGTCVISNNVPSYDDTEWQQIDTITTDSSTTIPIWERIA